MDDGKIVALRIELEGSNEGMWPLRPLKDLRKLQIGDGVEQKIDLSALIDLNLESLDAPAMVLTQIENVIREIKSLKTINGQPVGDYFRTEKREPKKEKGKRKGIKG